MPACPVCDRHFDRPGPCTAVGLDGERCGYTEPDPAPPPPRKLLSDRALVSNPDRGSFRAMHEEDRVRNLERVRAIRAELAEADR